MPTHWLKTLGRQGHPLPTHWEATRTNGVHVTEHHRRALEALALSLRPA